eukprot:182560_1
MAVKYTNEEKLYLNSIRHRIWPYSHSNLVWTRETYKKNNFSAISSIYGHPYTPAATKQGVDFLRNNFNTQPNDVLISSFPRSGTHWMMKICLEIMRHCSYDEHNLPPEYKNADYRFIPQLEPMTSQSNASRILDTFIDRYNTKHPSLRFSFTHSPWHLLPVKHIHPKTKIIRIVRNPKDTMTSNYHINLDVNKGYTSNADDDIEDMIKFEHIFEDFMNGVCYGGNWWDMVIEWYLAAKDSNNNILLVYYEEIKENPQGMVRKIANFLGKDDGARYLDPTLLHNERILNLVCEQCTFQNQKKTVPRGWGFIIRKGIVGDWKNFLTRKQVQKMDERTRIKFHEMTDIRYNQLYRHTPSLQSKL